jgi:hypothetical protein
MTASRVSIRLRLASGLLWWPIATFFLLTLPWRIHERFQLRAGVIRPAEPIPGMQLQPGFSWTMALVYVAAWWWLWIAYSRAALATGVLLPGASNIRGALGGEQFRMAVILATLLLMDQLPLSLWRLILDILGP